MPFVGIDHALAVTDAARRGVSGLVVDADRCGSIVVERRGVPRGGGRRTARMREILEREDDLRSAALVLTRAATDDGARSSPDEVIETFGFDVTELKRELGAELAAETHATPS